MLDATAGTPFSHTFSASGGSGPLEYLFNGHFLLPDTITWDEQTGVIGGTFPEAGSYDLEVAATDQHDSATQFVRIDVAADPDDAAVGMIVGVTDTTAAEPSVWAVAADGSTTHSDSPEVQSGDPTVPLRVPQDHALQLNPLLVDRSGRVTVPTGVVWSSTVPGDTFAQDAEGEATTLTFAHASPHVITARSGVVSVSFTVTVDPLASTADATPTPTAAGALAFTGPEHTRGLLAWAIGLLAAGGGVLVFRLRRRA